MILYLFEFVAGLLVVVGISSGLLYVYETIRSWCGK